MHYPFLFAGYLSLMFTCLNLLPIGQLDGGHVVYGLFGFSIHRLVASLLFVALLLYAGLGFFSSDVVMSADAQGLNLGLWVAGAIAFCYMALSGLGLTRQFTIMSSLLMVALLLVLSRLFPDLQGYPGWLVFLFVLGKFIGIQHPPSEIEEPLDDKRVVLGWIALAIFVVCFSPAPIVIR
jgi:membrane-associated protease RseP (regulator of RpoE activity)